MNFKATAVLCTAVAAVAIAPIATSTDAEAKSIGGRTYSERFFTKGPERGYEGFVGIGKHSQYCSYRREPIRRCVLLSSGREKCKIISWSLIQHCY